jgi:prepilin-type N-terminal cleavage/methylation domain-containing protein
MSVASGILMKDRKGFTLVELLVVIGIIALLAGILLPAVNHMRRSAQITAEKADFQSIGTALEQYKSDFGDYPRNVNLPTWNTNTSPAYTAPIYYSLAASLLGPGPASSETVGSGLEIGDGSDGPGFRCQISGAIPNASTNPVSITPGATSVTIFVNPQYIAQASAFASNFVNPPSPTSSSPTPASITFFPTATDPYPETVGISGVTPAGSPSGSQLTLNFSSPSPIAAAHNGNCLIIQPSGKVWGPYISADTFKIAFIPSAATDANGNAVTSLSGLGQPVLLDRWGQVIQYFPTYGTVSNRTKTSVLLALNPGWTTNPPSAGPLYGYSQPNTIDATKGQNTIWDFRDGAPFFSVSSLTSAAQPWPDPTISTEPNNFHPNLAIQWMLGDQPDATNKVDDAITASEKLANVGPYILISAGPDNASGFRTNGGYCNMVDSTGSPLPANTWQQTFINSGNIYNFDRQ